jgi:hypothetical protein
MNSLDTMLTSPFDVAKGIYSVKLPLNYNSVVLFRREAPLQFSDDIRYFYGIHLLVTCLRVTV